MTVFDLLTIDDRDGEAVKQNLGRALTGLKAGEMKQAYEDANLAYKVAVILGDSAGQAMGTLIIGLSLLTFGLVEPAQSHLSKARAIFGRQPAWRHRLNESVCWFAIGITWVRVPEPSVSQALAAWSNALKDLDMIRFYYLFDKDGKGGNGKVELIDRYRSELEKWILSASTDPIQAVEQKGGNQYELA
jgi:hypothetical protein